MVTNIEILFKKLPWKISWLNSVFKPGKCSSVIYVLEKS